MTEKQPVLLTILVDTSRMRWLAGSIGLDHEVTPLLASHDNDLAEYRGLDFDEQASFLRHRFCGVLQRGCDRLWGKKMKACHFVFVIDRPFPDASPELTERIADHLVQWMAKPPVVFYSVRDAALKTQKVELDRIAGDMPDDLGELLNDALPSLVEKTEAVEEWELVPPPAPRN